MKKYIVLSVLISLLACSVTKWPDKSHTVFASYADSLRYLYSLPAGQWPSAQADDPVRFKELGILPQGPLVNDTAKLHDKILLGKMLFFDPRLSSSGKISCASCHQPELSWADGKARSVGHEGAVNKRNAPGLQDVWFYKKLFWDGRSHRLEDQAFSPINNESEMGSDMPAAIGSIRRIAGYRMLFEKAFGNIGPEEVTAALAVFQRTIISRLSSFDSFLLGNKKAMNDEAIRGLHLFRTKAGCINCHNGPLFSDNEFHNTGIAGADSQQADKGYFIVTRQEADRGKFKTPGLRDVVFTGPWMHDGSFNSLDQVVDHYNGKSFTGNDPKLHSITLSGREKKDIIAFLQSISSPPLPFERPILP